jgi:hypothetical protein
LPWLRKVRAARVLVPDADAALYDAELDFAG